MPRPEDAAHTAVLNSHHYRRRLKRRLAVLYAIPFIIAGTNAAHAAEICQQATAGTYQWQSAPFAPQTDMFTYYIHAQPQQPNTDTLVGLSRGPATNWTQLAAIIRFNAQGFVDFRDGDVYRALWPKNYMSQYNFSGDFRMQVDMRRKTYSVWYWSFDGDSWSLMANDFRFRTEQAGVTQLDHFTAEAETGGIDTCARDPEPWARVGTGAPQWRNAPTGRTAVYGQRYEFFVRPDNANMDGLVALSQGPQTSWSRLAAIVRFNSAGTVDVRNGGAYQADAVFNYIPSKTYRIYIYAYVSPDPANTPHHYSVSVSEVGGTPVRIANRYRFRTEQQGVTDLNNWVAEAELGGLTAYLAPDRWGY